MRESLLSKEVSWRALLCVLIFPATGGFLFGYDIGATSMVLQQLKGPYAGVPWGERIADSALLGGFFTASAVGGALLGVLIVFRIGDGIGRRRTLLYGALLYAAGGVLQALSSISGLGGGAGLTVVIIGRWVYGVACGFSMHGAPAYMAEMSPPNVRGLMVSMKEAAIVAGILVGQGVGYGFRYHVGAWRYTYGLSIPLALVMFFGMLYMPPSARWLGLQGRYVEAEASLRFFMQESGARQAMAEIHQQCSEYMSRPKESVLGKRYMWQLVVGVGLVTLQQISGQPSVLYYANEIFAAAHLSDASTIGVGAFKLLATMAAVFTVDRYGRRKLLLVGVTLMLLALVAITGCFIKAAPEGAPDGVKATLIGAMFLYIGGYQVGFGPVSWLLISEIFPLEVRGSAVAISVSSNFFWNLLVTLIFEEEIRVLGAWPTFAIFAFITLASLLFIHFLVPETKGLSLEQIESLYHQGGGGGGGGRGGSRRRRNSALPAPSSPSSSAAAWHGGGDDDGHHTSLIDPLLPEEEEVEAGAAVGGVDDGVHHPRSSTISV